MRIARLSFLGLMVVLILGCNADKSQPVDQGQQVIGAADDTPGPLLKSGMPPGFYSFSGTNDINEGFLNLVQINTRTGLGTTIWKLGIQNDPVTGEVLSPFGLAFDVDGAMYTFVCWLDFIQGDQHSRLARVDRSTGAVTYIGQPIPLHFAGPDIDANGNLYVTGFTVGAPEPGSPPLIFGNDILYRVNKVTGVPTPVGHTGRTDWMDLAFDSHGRLWATTDNKLYCLNTKTGNATFVANITGVPHQNIPGVPPEDWPYMEVMTIAFDDNNVLWATAMKGFSSSLGNGIVMRIDANTGRGTLVGYTGKPYNHGGDIMPSRVRICHRTGRGRYESITISMEALPAHLAHGDYVPGAAGSDHNCP